MYIYPAIDLFQGKAVRLFKGDYAQMTVYSENPVEVAEAFKAAGATRMHLVDLEGAKKRQPCQYRYHQGFDKCIRWNCGSGRRYP